MTKISVAEGSNELVVPDDPDIVIIPGDGIGPEVSRAAQSVLDAAVSVAYNGKRTLRWQTALAGDAAYSETKEWLPKSTIESIKEYKVALKGPLTTPVGGGIRSLNVALRQILNLYQCVRPVRYFRGVPSPMKHPEQLDVVIFRENTEDVYAGYEYEQGSPEAEKLIGFLNSSFGVKIPADSGLGIKPISITKTHCLVRAAMEYAIKHRRKCLTLVHKGNIMKFTEGAFKEWGMDLLRKEYPEIAVFESDGVAVGDLKPGQILVNDRIADNMFQQVLTRPSEYEVIATMNLNGDYLSDACAAQVGGLGMAPGANIGSDAAIFEATHGTAPKYAGLDKVNPSSLILSGAMMLEHLGWNEAADMIYLAIERTIVSGQVTYDLARQLEGSSEVACSEFAAEMIANMSKQE